ncbi:hypothetical protein MOTC310_24350 [Methylobacterium oryzae]|uniref:Uncharacterized protein n=1 Tax=Methylobacterium oryzae TaxID=334852 RepID=A0ABU7TV07_9HYPH
MGAVDPRVEDGDDVAVAVESEPVGPGSPDLRNAVHEGRRNRRILRHQRHVRVRVELFECARVDLAAAMVSDPIYVTAEAELPSVPER